MPLLTYVLRYFTCGKWTQTISFFFVCVEYVAWLRLSDLFSWRCCSESLIKLCFLNLYLTSRITNNHNRLTSVYLPCNWDFIYPSVLVWPSYDTFNRGLKTIAKLLIPVCLFLVSQTNHALAKLWFIKLLYSKTFLLVKFKLTLLANI